MFIICFDYGLSNIGVSIGQFITKTASPLICLRAKNGVPNWLEIKKIFDVWNIKTVVIGYPYFNENNEYKKIYKYIKIFANNLKKKFKVNIFFYDESYTSCESYFFIKDKNHFFYCTKSNIHSISAVFILERWFVENY